MGILAESESLFYVSSLLLYIQANSDGVVWLINLQHDMVSIKQLSRYACRFFHDKSTGSSTLPPFSTCPFRISLSKITAICLDEAFTSAFIFPDQHSYLQAVKTLGHSSFPQLKGNWLNRSAMAHFCYWGASVFSGAGVAVAAVGISALEGLIFREGLFDLDSRWSLLRRSRSKIGLVNCSAHGCGGDSRRSVDILWRERCMMRKKFQRHKYIWEGTWMWIFVGFPFRPWFGLFVN